MNEFYGKTLHDLDIYKEKSTSSFIFPISFIPLLRCSYYQLIYIYLYHSGFSHGSRTMIHILERRHLLQELDLTKMLEVRK